MIARLLTIASAAALLGVAAVLGLAEAKTRDTVLAPEGYR